MKRFALTALLGVLLVSLSGCGVSKSVSQLQRSVAFLHNGAANVPNGQYQITVMKEDGTGQTPGGGLGDYGSASLSYDGSKIVFDQPVNNGNAQAVFVMNADGTSQVQLTNDGLFDQDAHFSIDGTKIAFDSYNPNTNSADIWVMNADGSNPVNLTNNPSGTYSYFPNFTINGTQIVFESGTSNTDIFLMNADGTSPVQLTSNAGSNILPAISPNGQLIAFASDRASPGSGQVDIYTMSIAGAAVTRVTTDGASWAPEFVDNSHIIFASMGSSAQIYNMNTAGNNKQQLTTSGYNSFLHD
jgi:Tol biopolymer transport system component